MSLYHVFANKELYVFSACFLQSLRFSQKGILSRPLYLVFGMGSASWRQTLDPLVLFPLTNFDDFVKEDCTQCTLYMIWDQRSIKWGESPC